MEEKAFPFQLSALLTLVGGVGRGGGKLILI